MKDTQMTQCPNCLQGRLAVFYELRDVPVYNVRLMHSHKQARTIPRGDIELGVCDRCGFIGNTRFVAEKLVYGEDWEESQGSSEVFRRFHENLAVSLVDRHQLQGGVALEIGCGKGEFLELLCKAGCDHAIAYDPAYLPGRISEEMASRITVYPRNFTAEDKLPEIDSVYCKMTLEHIPQTAVFIKMLRKALYRRSDIPVFFMVPDMQRILNEGAFWDVYYEHCSYFTAGSLACLFAENGFKVSEIESLYDGQYLGLNAFCHKTSTSWGASTEKADKVQSMAQQFSARVAQQRSGWQSFLAKQYANGRRTVIWGGSSKTVAFLCTMQVAETVDYVIDINPRKQGCFLPGSGHRVVSPSYMKTATPDVVIIMNSVYRDEIASICGDLELSPELLLIEQDAPV